MRFAEICSNAYWNRIVIQHWMQPSINFIVATLDMRKLQNVQLDCYFNKYVRTITRKLCKPTTKPKKKYHPSKHILSVLKVCVMEILLIFGIHLREKNKNKNPATPQIETILHVNYLCLPIHWYSVGIENLRWCFRQIDDHIKYNCILWWLRMWNEIANHPSNMLIICHSLVKYLLFEEI